MLTKRDYYEVFDTKPNRKFNTEMDFEKKSVLKFQIITCKISLG